jgi:bifunctional non-homologous end joining protein LigD
VTPAETPNRVEIPRTGKNLHLGFGDRVVRVSNLDKVFFPEIPLTKRDLIQYYVDVAPWLLPHIARRPMVMKRQPNGAAGDFFYMKNAPSPRPDWIETVSIPHDSGTTEFPLIDDLPSLVWVINLGCIDLNPWYSRADDWNRPDFLHFDLDPSPGATFAEVREVALHVRDLLAELGIPSWPKTTGSRGIHVYVPIRREPVQDQVWAFAKTLAHELARRHHGLVTVEYAKAKRPKGSVLVDYNQNAWGQTLASIYSVRPRPTASVSTPVTWAEVEGGIEIDDFRIDTVRERLTALGDLWDPVLGPDRVDLLEMFGR